jgi:flagellar M-ring protein FliF
MAAIDLDRLKEHGKRFVDGFTPGQKAMTILGVVAVVFAGMTFMRWASTPDYAPLYTGLSSQDAGAVTQQLDSQGVKYKLTGGGGTIMVARADVYKTRVGLSTKGLPSGGGDSFALLDKQGITTDEFTRNVDYQRALQGELSKTIESIDGIQNANVTLTIPKDSVFVGATEDKPTAAVLVTASSTPSSSTVQSIAHLVASSIPNMNPDEVTVADSTGKVLHAPGTDLSGSGGAAMEAQQTFETAVQKKVENMIAGTIGPGHAAVTVSADLDMSKSHSQTTTYQRPGIGATPGTTDVPSEVNNSSENLNQPANSGTGGVLGPGNNGGNTTTPAGAGTTYNKTTTQARNALDTTQITADSPPGAVKRMSVSVLLDSAVVPNPGDATAVWQPQIVNAAGIVPARDGGTAVKVSTIAFDQKALKAAKAAATAPAPAGNAMFDLIKHFLTLLMIGLVLLFAWRAIKRAEANRVPLRVPIDLRELEAGAGAAAALPSAVPTGAAVAAAAGGRSLEAPPPSIEAEITDLIESQPDDVAQTLRSWLADRRG